MKVKISEQEAVEMIALAERDESDNYPQRFLNEKGEKLITDWLSERAKRGQSLCDWFLLAEDQARDAWFYRQRCVLELKAWETLSERVETIWLDDTCFDWYKLMG